jgi:hypothetical protein
VVIDGGSARQGAVFGFHALFAMVWDSETRWLWNILEGNDMGLILWID